MEIFKLNQEYIKLGSFVKCLNLISSGGEAKPFLESQKIYVNHEIENRRGRKLYHNDVVLINQKEYLIQND